MWRTVAQVLKRQCHVRYWNRSFIAEECLSQRLVFKKLELFPLYGYSTSALVSERERFSVKILKHFRANTHYVESPVQQETLLSLGNVNDVKYALEKTLLLIAHNPSVNVSDVLQLFSLYVSSGQFVMQDVIKERTLMRNVQKKVLECIKLMNLNEMQQLAVCLDKLRGQEIKFLNSIKKVLANQCEIRASESELAEVLKLFDVLLILYESIVYRIKEYNTFISLFEYHINSAKPHELVQILYFIGLAKRKRLTTELAESVIKKLEPKFSDFSFFDAGIAVSSIFKSGVKLDMSSSFTFKIVQHIQKRVKEPHNMSDLETYAFVAMIKVLRRGRFESEEFYSLLSEVINNKIDFICLTPQVVSHILALYANNRIYDKELFSKLEKVTLDLLKDEHSKLRIMDISRMLWSFSHTGHDYSPDLYRTINSHLSFFMKSQVRKDHYLSDSLFALVISGWYPKDLLKEAFMPEQLIGLREYQRSKMLSRLITLYECLNIEVPELNLEKPELCHGELPVRTVSDEVYHRPGVSKVMGGVKYINEILGANVLQWRFLLPSINHVNLIVDSDKLKSFEKLTSCESSVERDHVLEQLSVVKENSSYMPAIEIQEPHFLIRPTLEPIGIIRLKLRLLRQSGWDVKILSYDELDQCGNDTKAIAALLLDKIASC